MLYIVVSETHHGNSGLATGDDGGNAQAETNAKNDNDQVNMGLSGKLVEETNMVESQKKIFNKTKRKNKLFRKRSKCVCSTESNILILKRCAIRYAVDRYIDKAL